MKKEFKILLINSQKLLYKFKESIKKMLWALGRDAFLFILIFVLLDMVFGEFLFYNYVFLTKIKEPEVALNLTKFQANTYQSVVKEWQYREDAFSSSSEENYLSPF